MNAKFLTNGSNGKWSWKQLPAGKVTVSCRFLKFDTSSEALFYANVTLLKKQSARSVRQKRRYDMNTEAVNDNSKKTPK